MCSKQARTPLKLARIVIPVTFLLLSCTQCTHEAEDNPSRVATKWLACNVISGFKSSNGDTVIDDTVIAEVLTRSEIILDSSIRGRSRYIYALLKASYQFEHSVRSHLDSIDLIVRDPYRMVRMADTVYKGVAYAVLLIYIMHKGSVINPSAFVVNLDAEGNAVVIDNVGTLYRSYNAQPKDDADETMRSIEEEYCSPYIEIATLMLQHHLDKQGLVWIDL